MPHIFKVGQLVRANKILSDGVGRDSIYEVVRLLPPESNGLPKYHIKSVVLKSERVVDQCEITAASRGLADVS